MNIIKKNIKKKGFTLVEMLITMFVFSLVISSIIGLFIVGIQNQRYVLDQQLLLNEVSYVMEYMSRSLRMAKYDEDGSCITIDKTYESPSSERIKFINALEEEECQEFYLENETLKKNPGNLNLTSDKIKITNLQFHLEDDEDTQPRVTILLEAEIESSAKINPKIKIQTTVSLRDI